MISIWIHAVKDIIRHRHYKRVNLQPVVETLVLLLIEASNLLVFNLIELGSSS